MAATAMADNSHCSNKPILFKEIIMASNETRAAYNIDQHDTGDYFLDWLEVDGPHQKEFLRNVGEETIAASLVDIRAFFALRSDDERNMVRLTAAIGARLLNYLVDSGKSQTDAVLELAHQREIASMCESDCNDDR